MIILVLEDLRQVVMEKTKSYLIKLLLQKLIKKLKHFDQMFLTNSILKVVPVKSLGKKIFIGENLKNLLNFFEVSNRNFKKKNLELF